MGWGFGDAFRRAVSRALFAAITLAALTIIAAPSARAMGAYAIEPAYKEYPLQGPEKAKGLVIWNHGLYGTMTQYTYPPPFIIAALAARGWDVVKLDRNPTYENGWTNAGQKHIARLIDEAEAARNRGYAHIILAGQSYGGAIALEAARRFHAFAVIAMAPSTGQEVRNSVIADTWTNAIVRATNVEVEDLKADRALLVMPADDEYLRGADRAPKVRELLNAKGTPYLMIDHQVHGHGGGYTKDFIPYAACAMWMLDPAANPKPGEFQCYKDDVKPAMAALGLNPGDAAKAWFGYSAGTGQEIVVLQKGSAIGAAIEMGWGAGLFSQFKGGVDRFTATQAGNTLNFAGSSASITMRIDGGSATFMEIRKDTKEDPVTATLWPLHGDGAN